jgi:hypothetical protein
MQHPVLGEISPAKHNAEAFEAEVRYRGNAIPIGIDPDGEEIEAVLALASKVVASLEEIDENSRIVAARDLLATHNNGWNEYDEVMEDGSTRTIHNPELTEDEFRDRLTLSAVNVLGVSNIDIWFEDGGLFWGHGVCVSSFDGLDLTGARAELYG